MADIKKLTVRLEVKAGDANKQLDKSNRLTEKIKTGFKKIGDVAKRTGQKIKSSFSQAAKGMGTFAKLAVGGTLIYAGKRIINMAGDMVEAYNKQFNVEKQLENRLQSTRNAVGMTSAEIKKLASNLQDQTIIGDEVILSGQNMLLTFTNIGKDVFPQATEALLNMSSAMTQGKVTEESLNSQAIQLGKALNDPIMGISALRRVGVQLTKQQEENIKTLVEQNKVTEAQKIILSELETQFGGTAKAYAEGMGMFKQIDNAMDDIKESIGGLIAQALLPLGKAIKPVIISFKNWLGTAEGMKRFIFILKLIGVVVIPLVVGAIGLLIIALWGLVAPAWAAMAPFLPFILAVLGLIAAVTALVLFWDDIVNFFKEWYRWMLLLLGPIGIVINALIELQKRFQVFTKIGGFFKSLFGGGKKEIAVKTQNEQKAVRTGGTGVENVNDAIITKDGKVIHTAPDDNLIATKSDPMSGMGGVNLTFGNIIIQTKDSNSLPGDFRAAIKKALDDLVSDFRSEAVLA